MGLIKTFYKKVVFDVVFVFGSLCLNKLVLKSPSMCMFLFDFNCAVIVLYISRNSE